jgi:plasmid stabilization system protein ParE
MHEIPPRVIYSRAAKLDTNDAVRWYNARAERLGEEFLRSIDEAVAQLRRFPESGPLVYGRIRYLLLQRFPYSLYYVYEHGRLRVIAVMHWRRDPAHWQARAP